MKTLHEIYDAICTVNTVSADECVIYLTAGEFNMACNAIYNQVPSSDSSRLIKVESYSDITPWLVPKYADECKVGYVLGVSLQCVFTTSDIGNIECSAEIVCRTNRDDDRPKLYKTIQAAINDCPATAENVTLWTH